jgi:hypothetical protein
VYCQNGHTVAVLASADDVDQLKNIAKTATLTLSEMQQYNKLLQYTLKQRDMFVTAINRQTKQVLELKEEIMRLKWNFKRHTEAAQALEEMKFIK